MERQVCSIQGLISYFDAFVLVINQTDALLECRLRYIGGNLWMTPLKYSISTAGINLSQVILSARIKLLAVGTEESGTGSMRVLIVTSPYIASQRMVVRSKTWHVERVE